MLQTLTLQHPPPHPNRTSAPISPSSLITPPLASRILHHSLQHRPAFTATQASPLRAFKNEEPLKARALKVLRVVKDLKDSKDFKDPVDLKVLKDP